MSWNYIQPAKILFGNGRIKELENLAEKYKRPLLVTDKFFVSNGTAEKIKEITGKNKTDVFSDFSPNPDVSEVNRCTQLLREKGSDLIIAFGGGSAIDLAKAVSVNVDDISDYHGTGSTGKKIPAEHLPLIAVPTTSGTGSEVTCVSVLTDKKSGKKAPVVSESFYPATAVIDPELTLTLPPEVTASTGIDVLCHAVEGYWSRFHQPICDALAVYAIKNVFEFLPKAYNEPDNLFAREKMCEASVIAGLAFTLPKTTSSHACSFPLTNLYHIPHGEACGLTLDYFARVNSKDKRTQFLAETLGFENVNDFADYILSFKKKLGLRTNLKDLNLTEEQTEELVKLSHHPNMENNPVEKADGIYFWDYNGKKYYDMSSQLANVNLGYGNKDIIKAIQKQVEILPYIAPAHASGPRSQLAKMLIDIAPDNMGKVFFACGGSDSNEAAIYAARTFTGRSKILTRYRSYHGSTLGSGNLSGDPRRFALEKPAAGGFLKFFDPYVYRSKIKFKDDAQASEYYLDLLEQQIQYEGQEQIAAIEVESITGANGVIIPPDGYLQGLRKLCDKYGILLICDEVMAGFGRTGKMFGFEHWGIKPDIITFAKGVTCGYVQLGGIIISKEIAEFFEDKTFLYGLTYSGHSLACAAGVAAVNYYKEHNILEHVNEVGKVFGELLEEIKANHKSVGDVRYIGLFGAVELVKDKETKEPIVPYGHDEKKIMPQIHGLLKERGFSAFGRENNINITPPLIITEQELRDAFKILDEVLTIVDEKFI